MASKARHVEEDPDWESAEAIRRDLLDAMQIRFGVAPERVRWVRAPYRICPLGAHIDHQHGTVTALAIDRAVLLAFAPSPEPGVRMASLSFPGEVAFPLDRIPPKEPGDWGNYPRGAAFALARGGILSRGLVGVTSGRLSDLGLSSSSAVGLACLLALGSVNRRAATPADLIRLNQTMENEYLGLRNGILDQAAILLSRAGSLTVIDCRAFAEGAGDDGNRRLPAGIRRVRYPAGGRPFVFLVATSGLLRSVVSTAYNRRVEECAEAARSLLEAVGRPVPVVPRLGDVRLEEYEANRGRLSGPHARRAAHFFGETRRVREGIAHWRSGDLVRFGSLMTESGLSSIKNYECGCEPMNDLYRILVRAPGVRGARFSGAGFRGCCVALAEPEAVREAIPYILREYGARHPGPAAGARVLVCRSGPGAGLS
jgi:galacturonokinase